MKPSFFGPLIAVVLLIFNAVNLRANDSSIQTLPDGIAVKVGAEQVEIRAASPYAFRLHVFVPPDAAKHSIYLSDTPQQPADCTIIHEGTAAGIKTSFGALLVDSAKGEWMLRDGGGATLTNWASLGQPGSSTFQLDVGASPTTTPIRFYGSGNLPNPGALTQTEGASRTENGRAGLPQYWSTAGYGALMIGQNDNAPGSWKKQADGSVSWTVPGAGADLYLMPARNLQEWLRADANLTGAAPVPALWTFGYIQSRWGWENKAYIDDAFAHFRRDKLPVDAFIFDFEWYTTKPDYSVKPEGEADFVDFDFNSVLLPDPAKQIADFTQQGLHIIGIRKPRLGNAANLTMARSKGWVAPISTDHSSGAAPPERNLDFSRPDARKYWEENNRKFLEAGMAAFWNDEGEVYYTEYSYWNMAEVDLLRQVDPHGRFWSLNRSFIPGVQRFGAAAWTGDIEANWQTLQRTPGELLSYGLSGMPYSACDIGGFVGNTTPELLSRWMEAGIFFPVMRSHSEISCIPHFPWLFGPEAEAAIRQALDLRYRLIPYYYGLAHENYATSEPMMRPLVMEFPDDAKAADLTDEWLMGKGLLAAPILSEGGTRSVYLPKDTWFRFGTTRAITGPQTVNVTAKLDEVPAYVRAGTLLPLGPVRQYTGQASDAPLELQIYPGHDATFTLIEDDGKTLAYQSGHVRSTTFSWNDRTGTLSWKVAGDYSGTNVFHAIKAVFFSSDHQTEKQAELNTSGSVQFP